MKIFHNRINKQVGSPTSLLIFIILGMAVLLGLYGAIKGVIAIKIYRKGFVAGLPFLSYT